MRSRTIPTPGEPTIGIAIFPFFHFAMGAIFSGSCGSAGSCQTGDE